MAYYETPEDRQKELKVLNKCIELYDELGDYDFTQREEDKQGVIFDHFGKSKNRLLVKDIYVDVKILYGDKDYDTNIISVSKYNAMANNPEYDFYMLYFYKHFMKFRLRQITKDDSKFQPNFKCVHKRATALQGTTVIDNSPVYFLYSPYKEKFLEQK